MHVRMYSFLFSSFVIKALIKKKEMKTKNLLFHILSISLFVMLFLQSKKKLFDSKHRSNILLIQFVCLSMICIYVYACTVRMYI